jgi:hypothetical protein
MDWILTGWLGTNYLKIVEWSTGSRLADEERFASGREIGEESFGGAWPPGEVEGRSVQSRRGRSAKKLRRNQKLGVGEGDLKRNRVLVWEKSGSQRRRELLWALLWAVLETLRTPLELLNDRITLLSDLCASTSEWKLKDNEDF